MFSSDPPWYTRLNEALVIDGSQVARIKLALTKGDCCFLGSTPISLRHIRTLGDDLTNFSRYHALARIIQYSKCDTRNSLTD
jgi:hypothetical protein